MLVLGLSRKRPGWDGRGVGRVYTVTPGSSQLTTVLQARRLKLLLNGWLEPLQ